MSRAHRKDFTYLPQVRLNRTKFDMPSITKTTMNVGTLYPIDVQEVLPGDSFKTNVNIVARVSSQFLKPVMDNLFMDVFHFFVPYRLVYDGAEGVFGNPNPSAYVDSDLNEMPVTDNIVAVPRGTVFDYLGLPVTGNLPKGINVLPARAFALIYDKWFRNENVIQEMYIQKGYYSSTEQPNNNPWAPNNYTGKLPKVSKKKDYFTSCLPAPQKGGAVTLPLGQEAPVTTGLEIPGLGTTAVYEVPLKLANRNGNAVNQTYLFGINQNKQVERDFGYPLRGFNVDSGNTNAGEQFFPTNLWADLSNATATTVNDLRFAFQLQRMLEADSLYGSRYNEFLLGHFGVSSPDARLQIPEYLGGGRFPISVQQVNQTSPYVSDAENVDGSTEIPGLGAVAGTSLSNGHSKYSKGFVEHGYVFTVACLKQIHTYCQGVPKMFFRKSRNDFYDPLFAHLGLQPVYTSEIYNRSDLYSDDSTLTDSVFGYNEAWADYRYKPSKLTGQMRTNIGPSFDIWHFGDYYSNAPAIVKDFIEETPVNVDRTIAIDSTVGAVDQFLCDFYFDTKAIRVMPAYSVPGLIDHR